MNPQKNIIAHNYLVSREDRNIRNGHKSLVLWFTGLSGSGKSTIANALEQQLFKHKIQSYSLDGDNIRGGLNRGLGFTEEDRHENIRRIAEVGKILVECGMVTITAFISPLEKDRKLAQEIIGTDDFVEIFINTPLEICEKRDVKGLYKKARAGEIRNFTGLDAPYEPPQNPAFEIKTEEVSVDEAVEHLLEVLLPKIKI